MVQIQASQIYELTLASIKSRYRSSFAGFIWVILNPLLIFVVQSYAFSLVLKIDMERYYLFLLSGLLPWLFLTQCIDMGTPIFVVNANLLKSFPIHPLALLIAMILDNAINFLCAFLLILLPVAIYQGGIHVQLFLLPICVVLLLFTVSSLSWLLASLHVFFRDTKYIASFGMVIAYFLTPIFYPRKLIPESYHSVLFFNPFYYIVEPFHVVIHTFNWTDFFQSCQNSIIVGFIFFLLASWIWTVKRNAIYNKF